ncbi:MAG: acyl-CoA reductase [Flavobacteriales bacterium]|nr:acyl-CoA reductase [Flavobacteriales bacterium]
MALGERKDAQDFVSQTQWEKWNLAKEHAQVYNQWFTQQNIDLAFKGLGNMLEENKAVEWLSKYVQKFPATEEKKVGVIMAGNIPLVGFHDMMCVLISGHKALCKMSSDDNVFYPLIKEQLVSWNNEWEDKICLIDEKLEGHEAVIATGSNNTARYFEYYFKEVPHIIRKNRNAVAILDGNESKEEIFNLGEDIFQFFGLGCRNVSKVFLPEGFELNRIYEGIFEHGEVIHHNKWCNNYEYNKAVYLLSTFPFLDNNFLLLKEDDEAIVSPLGVLFYQFYRDEQELRKLLEGREEEIQCIISKKDIPFGKAQCPELWDYADGVDTMEFLIGL